MFRKFKEGTSRVLSNLSYRTIKRTVFEATASQATAEPCKVIPGAATSTSKGTNNIIVLIGWGGAKERHLRRLREEYTNRGFATILFLPSMWGVVEGAACEGAAAELLLALRDYLSTLQAEEEGAKPSIIFHTHSNNSSFFIPSVMHCLKYSIFSEITEAYTGTIYDSNPGHANLKNIPQPKEFSSALDRYYADVERADRPFTVKVSNEPTPAAASSIGVVPPLPKDERAWQGTLQNQSHYPHMWLPHAFVMSIVINPVICGRYFHFWWTPVSTLFLLKEYVHTSARNAVHYLRNKSDALPPAIRFPNWLTPNAIPSMKRLAHLLAQSDLDGFKDNESGALRQLLAAHPLGPGLNRATRHPMRAPELFLYSKKDVLIAYWDIERFMYTRVAGQFAEEEKVPHVFAHRFNHTPHVAHYQKEPLVYMECVDNFVRFALEAKASTTSNAYPSQQWA